MLPATTFPILYLITDRWQYPVRHAWEQQLAILAAAAQAGCQLVQIREKDISDSELLAFVTKAIQVVRPYGTKVLVNHNVDVAIAAGADGVHLRSDSRAVQEIRTQLTNPDFLISLSTHSLPEAELAANDGADFIVCGPVFTTPSKLKFGAPIGLENFHAICQAVKIPVLGIGGITLANYQEILTAGAAGIAVIRLFNDPSTLGSNIKIMLSSERMPQD